jgi:hypothetical protein
LIVWARFLPSICNSARFSAVFSVSLAYSDISGTKYKQGDTAYDSLTILSQLLHLVLLLIVPLLQCGEFTVLLLDLALKIPEFNQNNTLPGKRGRDTHSFSATMGRFPSSAAAIACPFAFAS